MKYALVALSLAVAAQAQTREDIPECAISCLDDAIKANTDCDVTDYACVCPEFDALQGDATGCVVDACGPTVALNEVLPAVEALCAAIGNGAGQTSAGESSAPAETTTVVSTSEVVITTTSEVPVETTTMTHSKMPTGTDQSGQSTTASEQPVETLPEGGAAAVGSVGAAAMLLLAAFAL